MNEKKHDMFMLFYGHLGFSSGELQEAVSFHHRSLKIPIRPNFRKLSHFKTICCKSEIFIRFVSVAARMHRFLQLFESYLGLVHLVVASVPSSAFVVQLCCY